MGTTATAMPSSSQEDKLHAFLSVTCAEPELAQQLLESNDGDLEKAIESFFAIKEAETELEQPTTQDTVIDTNSNNENNSEHNAMPTPQAPCMEEEEEEEVVIPARRMAPRRSSSHSSRRHVPENLGEGRLGQLYAPPSDLNYENSYEQALEKGREEKKWVLVNLQQDGNFSCLLLNREVWSDSTIKEFIQSSFIFWQRDVLSDDAVPFCARYSVNSFPFVAVIDPRTGEKVLQLDLEDNERIEKNYIVSSLCNFLEMNVLDEWTAPRSSRRPDVPLVGSYRNNNDVIEESRHDERNEEDSQLAEAIAASLEERPLSRGEYSEFYSNEETRTASQYASMTNPHLAEERELKMEQDAALAAAEAADRARLMRAEEERKQKLLQKEEEWRQQEEREAVEATRHMRQRLKKSVLKDEPPENSPHVTELLLRLPDGRKVVRRFRDSDQIQVVVDFVVYETGLSEDEFQLIVPYPRKVLSNREATLADYSLITKAALIVERNQK